VTVVRTHLDILHGALKRLIMTARFNFACAHPCDHTHLPAFHAFMGIGIATGAVFLSYRNGHGMAFIIHVVGAIIHITFIYFCHFHIYTAYLPDSALYIIHG
jgi:hypothetical protein